jgi:hypothetical protein
MLRKQDDGDRQVVHVIPKSPKLEIRASLSTFHGKQFLDLRTFVASRAGEFVPTRLGITLPPEQLEELEVAVRRLRVAVSEAGPRE